ncbi:MAG: purine-nucleoside phosphorylase [Elusimicrobiota bacterium]
MNNSEIKEAREYIEANINVKPEMGLIFGSGLGELVKEFEDAVVLDFTDIPNFPESTVEGHDGAVVGGILEGKPVVALSGRIHYYEGHGMGKVVFPTAVMASMGIDKLLVSNAGGAVREDFTPGDIVIIKDHINFMGDNPLIGAPDFIDMTDAYNSKLRAKAEEIGKRLGIDLKSGVYMANSGPSYETPSEIKMARTVGADIVGMSTVPEVIMANKYDLKVVGLSMITNMAAGITGNALSHEEVIETTNKAKEKFKKVVRELVRNI